MQIDYSDIGNRIRAERVKQSISQERLAELAGVGTTHISHVETGNSIPSLKTFIAIINALNISADQLLRNHMVKSKHVLEGEISDLVRDCTDDETLVITDTIKALKTSLRINRKTDRG